jgi:hypothetical protein
MGLFGSLFGDSSGPVTPLPPVPPRYTTKYGVQIPFEEYNSPALNGLVPRLVRQDLNTYIPLTQPVEDDGFVATMNALGIPIMFITPYVYTRTLADDPTSTPPAFKTPDSLAHYMAASVKKYARKVAFWEIFNEPNAPAESNGGARSFTPAEYMSYLVPMSLAIRSSDPFTRVVAGATSGMPHDWHRQLASLGAAKYCDFLSFHPYGESTRSVVDSTLALQQIWGTTPLMCTEYGDADPIKAIAMHQALEGLVHTSVFFTLHGDPYGLIDAAGSDRASYSGAVKLFA